jgi:GxxExxY protein
MPYTREDDPETYAVIGAAMAVHSELGCGYLEVVYRAALKSEFRRRGISYENEVSLPIHYKGELLPFNYRVDSSAARSSSKPRPSRHSRLSTFLK